MSNRQKNFKEQAVRLITQSLENASAEHPLDLHGIMNVERPSLGNTVPVHIYRTVRLFALREALGADVSSAVLKICGRSAAARLGISTVPELVQTMNQFCLCRAEIESESSRKVVITAEECATCAGVPPIGEPLCHFESGLIEGALSGALAQQVQVTETECWGLGDRICRWVATPCKTSSGDDSLEAVISLVGHTATQMKNALVVSRKNRELREAYHRLRESERLKNDLVHMVVHDLRVPLTAITASLQTLRELEDGKLGRQQKNLLDISISGTDSLMQMINDILDIAKLEERRLVIKKEPSNLKSIIEKSMEQLGIVAARRKVQLLTNLPGSLPSIPADADRMHRVVMNLLSNALHHTPRGGRVSVTAGVTGNNLMRISVHDTGEGIPHDALERIFDKFAQVESCKTRRRSSSGLGLTFCKLVVEAHGGSIWAESKPDDGSTIHFELPLE